MSLNEQDYFEWLVSQIEIPNERTYWDLFNRMYDLEFYWIVPKDENRVQDGLDLRYQFSERLRNKLNSKGISILEVLVALSRRVAFIAGDGNAPQWAWKLIKNLRLSKMSDPWNDFKAVRTEEILYTLVWREYRIDGRGGFFPLKQPVDDQTKVEVWYQMNAYVNEMYE
jgi:hypothetical protein